MRRSSAEAARSSRVAASAMSASGDVERGQEAQRVVGGRHGQHLLGIAGRDHVGRGHAAFETQHQAGAAHRLEDRGMGRDEPLEPLADSAPLRATSARKASSATISITAAPTAQASGLPP